MSKLLARKPRTKRIRATTLGELIDEVAASRKIGVKQTRSKGLPEYIPTETQICIALVDYVNAKHPDLAEDFIHIPNENRCSWPEGKKLKAMGKKAGVSDYFLAIPKSKGWQGDRDHYHGLWLEIKSKRGKPTPAQIKFGQRQLAKGYAYKMVHSLEEGIAAIQMYLA